MKIPMRRSLPLLLLALCAASCKSADPAKPLRVSMIPTTDPGKATREMQPLVDHLARSTGGEVQMTIPTNYAAVVEALVNDQVDIAHLGGFTYVQASKRAGVKPLVQRERDREFHSLFVAQAGSPIKSLAELKGRSFAFVAAKSTSALLMPAYFMRRASAVPDGVKKHA